MGDAMLNEVVVLRLRGALACQAIGTLFASDDPSEWPVAHQNHNFNLPRLRLCCPLHALAHGLTTGRLCATGGRAFKAQDCVARVLGGEPLCGHYNWVSRNRMKACGG
jgi:hypothetical protein